MRREEISSRDAIEDMVIEAAKDLLKKKEEEYGKPLMDYLMKVIMLQSIDTHWKDHLLSMDHLKEGIGLRGYGQKDPVREYQKEGYEMFMEMIHRVKEDTIEKLCIVRIQREEEDRRDAGRGQSGLYHEPGRANARDFYGEEGSEEGGEKRSLSVRQREEI